MSHTLTYPLPAERGLVPGSLHAVREDGPEDDNPLDLFDAVTERLQKAEAVARLLQRRNVDMEAVPHAAWALADLLHEAIELYNRQWDMLRSR